MSQPAMAALRRLLEEVCKEDGTIPELVLSCSRNKHAAATRRKFSRRASAAGASQTMIGIALGRDHSTVHYMLHFEGYKKVAV